jgi:hypothetical protein
MSLWKPLHSVLEGLSPELRNRVDLVQIEDVLKRLAEDGECPVQLAGYAKQLTKKYIPS